MIILRSTPVEEYPIKDQVIYVKREDLCAPEGAPPFSKIRGLIPHLTKLKKMGFTTIGYTETAVSMAGWGVAWACKELGLNCVIFDPQYKNETPELLLYHRKQWAKFDAVIIPIPAGRAKVGWYQSRQLLKNQFTRAALLPLGLPLAETVEATSIELLNTLTQSKIVFKTIVVNVGSGTIAAGLWRGAETWAKQENNKKLLIIGVSGRSVKARRKIESIEKKVGFTSTEGGLFDERYVQFHLVDEQWGYTEKCEIRCPFPCHPWYDTKAWQYLSYQTPWNEDPTLFWNIGHLPTDF